jgi:hypothetical protein
MRKKVVAVSIAALVVWLVTVAVGSYMVRLWVSHGGLPGRGSSHFPAARVFTHLGLAVLGLVLWIVYLATGLAWLAWVAFADLVLVAVLGGLLFNRWRRDGRVAMSGQAQPGTDLAEQHIDRPPVVLHGVFAAGTLIVVLLAALGVGG